MPQAVVDHSSNAPETIEHAAKIIGRGTQRRLVFDAIYTGRSPKKTVDQIVDRTGLPRQRVLDNAKILADNHIVIAERNGRTVAYRKIDFYHRHKRKILSLATSKAKLEAFPTKRKVGNRGGSVQRIRLDLLIPKRKQAAKHITIDDVDNFAKVATIDSCANVKMPEAKFKEGVAKILGETGRFKDWGGENRDLSSTRLRIGGKRRIAAIAFNGPGTSGKLTPRKMGKNGDQIQRLVKCPGEVFIVQYWGDIEDSVLEQLKDLVTLKSFLEGKQLWYGIIDGNDSARLIAAYPDKFGKDK